VQSLSSNTLSKKVVFSMELELNRRQFVRRLGQASGLIVAGGTLETFISACGGNISTTTTSKPGTKLIASKGLMVPGELQWGSDSSSGAPYVYPDPNNPSQLVGFEVDIANAMAQLMGIRQKQIQTDYDQLVQALQAGKFDFIMNGWEITPDHAKTEVFSQPYYRYGQQIVVRVNDARFAGKTQNDVMSLKDLEGYTVGTGASYKAADILASDPKIKLKTYDPDLPFDDLALGRIDAVLIDLPMVTYYVQGIGPGGKADPRLKAIGKPFYTSDYVIGFYKQNPNTSTLLGEINTALTELKNNGTLHQIYVKWNLWNDQQAQIGTK
jgi:polar amino acid transport system substrate-binding protein